MPIRIPGNTQRLERGPRTGYVVQERHSLVSATSSHTAAIPVDGSIPQATEGAAITNIDDWQNTKIGNIVYIQGRVICGSTASQPGQRAIASLFVAESSSNAVTANYIPVSDQGAYIDVDYMATVTTTATIRIMLRAGMATGTMFVNGAGAGSPIAPPTHSFLKITEIQA